MARIVILGLCSLAVLAHAADLRAKGATDSCSVRDKLTVEQFEAAMNHVAEGWNEGNARKAAECFTEGAIYSAPPANGRKGRKALYEYFGGNKGRDLPMHMTWHHLMFDPERQVGAGEYTFRYKVQTHGMVIVKFDRGRISNWREYEIESNLPWEQFIGGNNF